MDRFKHLRKINPHIKFESSDADTRCGSRARQSDEVARTDIAGKERSANLGKGEKMFDLNRR